MGRQCQSGSLRLESKLMSLVVRSRWIRGEGKKKKRKKKENGKEEKEGTTWGETYVLRSEDSV